MGWPVWHAGRPTAGASDFGSAAMTASGGVEGEVPAQVLALILSADGSVSERALGLLDDLGAFALLGRAASGSSNWPALAAAGSPRGCANARGCPTKTLRRPKPCSMPCAGRTSASWSAAWPLRRWLMTGW